MGHSHTHSHANVSGKRLIWTILFNLIISLAELIGGLITGYLALIADSIHNLSDVAALGLAWLGVKGSQLPPTKRSTYGYKRVEVMTAFVSATALVVIAIYILFEAYDRFVNPQQIEQPIIFLTVAIIGLIGNVVSIWLLHSEKGKSLNLKTAFLHMAYDAVSSVAVILGGIAIIYTGWVMIDTILSALIALAIFWSSYLVMKEAVMIFMEAVPPGIDFDEVVETIEEIDGVTDVHDLHIWSISSHEIALSCHISVPAEKYLAGDAIIAAVRDKLCAQFEIGHTTIQIEQAGCDNHQLLCNQHPTGEQKP